MKLILLFLIAGCVHTAMAPCQDWEMRETWTGTAQYLQPTDLREVGMVSKTSNAALRSSLNRAKVLFKREGAELRRYLTRLINYEGITDADKNEVRDRLQDFNEKYFKLSDFDLETYEMSGRFDGVCATLPTRLQSSYIGQRVTWQTLRVGMFHCNLTRDGSRIASIGITSWKNGIGPRAWKDFRFIDCQFSEQEQTYPMNPHNLLLLQLISHSRIEEVFSLLSDGESVSPDTPEPVAFVMRGMPAMQNAFQFGIKVGSYERTIALPYRPFAEIGTTLLYSHIEPRVDTVISPIAYHAMIVPLSLLHLKLAPIKLVAHALTKYPFALGFNCLFLRYMYQTYWEDISLEDIIPTQPTVQAI